MAQAHITRGVTIVALSLALAACGKQEPAAPTAVEPAKAPASLSAADCDKLPDPKPHDDSATGKATAVSEGIAAREACNRAVNSQQDKANADLARIRAIKEKEEAERNARKVSEEEWKRGIKDGSKQPIKEYKF